MTFMQLMQQLEHSLGYHQWPVNAGAAQLHEVFESSPVNGELAIRIMRKLYKNNHCQKFTDNVSLDKCNAALIPVRLEVIRGLTTDIDAYHFMEQLCHAVHNAFTGEQAPQPAARDKHKAEIANIMPGKTLKQ